MDGVFKIIREIKMPSFMIDESGVPKKPSGQNVLYERSPEERRSYLKTSNFVGTGGILTSVATAFWMHMEAAKAALSNTETGVGGLIVGGSLAIAMNVASGFHNAAKYSNGPDSDAVHNISRISGTNMFGYIFGAAVGGLMCATAVTEQDNKRTEQILWANSPKMDPNTIVRQVTAAEEHCGEKKPGTLVRMEYHGKEHVFRCP